MPDNQALQVFYGTLPVILVITGVFIRSQTTPLMKDILDSLGRVEQTLRSVDKRLVVLETRLGLIHQP